MIEKTLIRSLLNQELQVLAIQHLAIVKTLQA